MLGVVLVGFIAPYTISLLATQTRGQFAEQEAARAVLSAIAIPTAGLIFAISFFAQIFSTGRLNATSSHGQSVLYAVKFICLALFAFVFIVLTVAGTRFAYGGWIFVAGYVTVLVAKTISVLRSIRVRLDHLYDTRKFASYSKMDGLPANAGVLLLMLGKLFALLIGEQAALDIVRPMVFGMHAWVGICCAEVIVLSLYRARLHWTMPEGIVAEPLPPLPQKKNG
jgi:hypothetical protein